MKFDDDGFLAEDVNLSLDELSASPLVTGEGLAIRRWNAERRELLVRNLRYVVESVRSVGFAGEIGVDGSFAAAVLVCRDIDAYLVLKPEDFAVYDERLSELNAREGENVWDFSEEAMIPMPGVGGVVTPLRKKYSVDLRIETGAFCGILGPHGERLTYPQAFRQRTQSKAAKGLILLRD